MNHETNIAPKDPAERLREAKARFSQSVLADDATFSVIKERLFDSSEDGADYPEFSLEPTLQRDETTMSDVGYRISKSRSTTDGSIGLRIASYDYLSIGELDRENGGFHVSPELEGLLASAGQERGAALQMMQVWQRATGELIQDMGDELVIDPRSNTFELASVVERTVYFE